MINLVAHVAILHNSYRHWLDRPLIPPEVEAQAAPLWLDQAPFALVSHNTASDPIFNYANRAALQLFEMSWDEFTMTPSRLSSGPVDRDERAALLARVARDGYIDDYTGIRVAKSGRRFMICNATVFNLLDEQGRYYGQAARLTHWKVL